VFNLQTLLRSISAQTIKTDTSKTENFAQKGEVESSVWYLRFLLNTSELYKNIVDKC